MLLLTDRELSEQAGGIIQPFDEKRVTNIGYDLSTGFFCYDEKRATSCKLAPGACVFVQTKEEIRLPNNMYAQVVLRNKRIRQGLELSCPVYQPGHHTRVFFRLMNVSGSVIELDENDDFVTLMLYSLEKNVQNPYQGTFQSEFDFRDLGQYAPELAGEMTEIVKKVDDVRQIEKTIYGNVLAIMAVFVAVFSLINVNVSLVAKAVEMSTLLTLNFVTIGSIATLIAVIQTCLPGKNPSKIVWMVCIVAYIASVVVQLIPFG